MTNNKYITPMMQLHPT